jgi:hypothetical protein
MELFIRIKEGQPFEHPIFGDNFRQAFPEVDTANLPPEFARFERVAAPAIGVYQVYEGVTYELSSGICRDVHHVRDMTSEEMQEKQNSVRSAWSIYGHASWVFDEETCSFRSPVSYPTDGNPYVWDEDTVSWKRFEMSN